MHILYIFSNILLIVLFYCSQAKAQPNYPPPTGVYCSCGPTTGTGNGSVDPVIAAKPFVKGILVRVSWDLIEPTDNSYNWGLIDGQITAAKSYGKKISLGVGCGIAIPQWLFTTGAQYLVSSVPISDTIAVPWDNVFLNKWTEFINAFGARYRDDTTIQLVYMTSSTGNGFEMQLPFVTNPTLTTVGYTDALMIQSWKTVVDAFDKAFPNHYLSNDFHPVNGSDAVADSVYLYAKGKIGTRYGANAWWWTQKNTTVYPAQYSILKNSSANNAFTGVQFAYNGTADSSKFGAGGMPAALQLAIADKVCYWEIWNQDILNTQFDSLLSNVLCQTTGSANEVLVVEEDVSVYPNPADDVLYITYRAKGNKEVKTDIFNVTGQLIQTTVLKNGHLSIDISILPKGMYFVRINRDGIAATKKIIKQ